MYVFVRSVENYLSIVTEKYGYWAYGVDCTEYINIISIVVESECKEYQTCSEQK